jgi:hypothetical protein
MNANSNNRIETGRYISDRFHPTSTNQSQTSPAAVIDRNWLPCLLPPRATFPRIPRLRESGWRNGTQIQSRYVKFASPTTTRARVPPPAALGMAGPKAAEDGSAAPLLPAQAGERSSGGVGGGATSAQTLGNVVVSIVGTGVLGLPYAFRAAGWVAGSIGVAAAGSATLYCMLLLVSTLARPPIPPY